MELIGKMLEMEPRVRRVTFWANLVPIGIATVLLSLWCVQTYTYYFDLEEHTYITHKPIYYAWLVIASYRIYTISAGRWQDLDKPGTLAFLNLFVFLSGSGLIDFDDDFQSLLTLVGALLLLAFIVLQGCMEGSRGTNRFGPPPEPGRTF